MRRAVGLTDHRKENAFYNTSPAISPSGDRIAFIYSGKLMAVGTQRQLYTDSGTNNLKDAFLAMADREGRVAV